MTHPYPANQMDGIPAFRALEAALVTNAVAAPGEAVNHDDEIMKLRLQPNAVWVHHTFHLADWLMWAALAKYTKQSYSST